ncbi:hypothetical protein BC332_34482 [Capsicum chinense]|nr:hypothetical protein BC332_34482 [Capsicum chinense]
MKIRVIASGRIPDPGNLKANDSTMLDVPVKVPHSVLISLARDIGGDWDVDYTLELGLIIDLPVIGNITIPLSYSGEYKLPTLSDLWKGGKEEEKKKEEEEEKEDPSKNATTNLTLGDRRSNTEVFKVKDPIITMNGVTVEKLDLVNTGGTILPMPKPGSNMTIKADVSVKNPNFASFRYSNTTTTISYHDTVVGEARGPSGKSKARGTTRINVTIDIITDKIVSHPGLQNDITTGLLTMNSYTRVGGRVKLLNMIKKHVIVKMNCSITVNITSQSIQDQKCSKKVKL